MKIDKKSTTANYEIAYTYFVVEQYDKAIEYSKKVIKQKTGNQQRAYVILGNSLDMAGNPDKAIKTYEEGLKKFPDDNMLNYNLALTCYQQRQYDKAEISAINAILAWPLHASSHVVLAAVMKEKGQRIKSLLPTYYFLMLEPNSSRSSVNYYNLKSLLEHGVEKKDEKNINVNILLSPSSEEFGAAEMMISLLAASKYIEENKDKIEIELFADANQSIFGILGELKKDNKGFWWDFYVTPFYEMTKLNLCEPFSYYISQSTDSASVKKWIEENPDKMQKLINWIEESL